MQKTTTELTHEYIKNHPHIRSCLKNGLINYSSLSRLISKDLNIEKKTSKEAILIAARRFQEKLKKEISYEKNIKQLLKNSEIEIKNKISVFILSKPLSNILDLQLKIRKNQGLFYLIEGSTNYTLIIQDKHASLVTKKVPVIKESTNLALINFKSPKEIETITGVISYLTSLFSENGINIVELLSCWTDTLFVIATNDVQKAFQLLNF